MNLLRIVFACSSNLLITAAIAQVPAIDPNVVSDRAWLSVLADVSKDCRESDVLKVFIDTPHTFKNYESFKGYRDSRETFKQVTSGSSKCWTFERWQTYVQARLPMVEGVQFKAREIADIRR